MNNLVNLIIVLAIIAALVLSIIAVVQSNKSDFEDGRCPNIEDCPTNEQWLNNCGCFYCKDSKYNKCPRLIVSGYSICHLCNE